MVTKERSLGAKIITFDAGSLNSQVARVVAQVGVLSYRLGLVLATLSVLLDPMIARPEGGPSSDMQRYED